MTVSHINEAIDVAYRFCTMQVTNLYALEKSWSSLAWSVVHGTEKLTL